MSNVNTNPSRKDRTLIRAIAARAVEAWPRSERYGFLGGDFIRADLLAANLEVDITMAHCNGCPLRLKDMLDANEFMFLHDVHGIPKNLNRKTGKLVGFFPRYAIES